MLEIKTAPEGAVFILSKTGNYLPYRAVVPLATMAAISASE
ncbi:MAG: hypothetical protein H6R01_1023 [Burkholderiaceae bacterium]|nr:hypothetical protein [Burkholderiaceae bacterium]